jgi:hypothetical protein
MESNGFSSQIASDHPSELFKYKSAKNDSSLEVTGRLSRVTQRNLSACDIASSTGLARQDGNLLNERSSYKNIHPSTIEDTEFLYRRLHGTRSQNINHQPTRPQTTQITSHNHINTSQHNNPPKSTKSVRILTPERAKSAYHTRTSVFQDRFSTSMTSSLPSLGLTNERTQTKTRHRSATSKPKSKISVQEFSPI